MNSNFIQFKKERDLGAIISDCFNFIRLNWKGYFGTIFRIAGPSLIVLIVALGFYMYSLDKNPIISNIKITPDGVW